MPHPADNRSGENRQQQLEIGERLKTLVQPVQNTGHRRQQRHQNPSHPHHAARVNAGQQRQIFVIRPRAHRLALPRAVQKPEHPRHQQHRHTDAETLADLQRQTLFQPAPGLKIARPDDELRAVRKALIGGADDKTHQPVINKHQPDGGNQQSHRPRLAPPVIAVHQPIRPQQQRKRHRKRQRQREQHRRQGAQIDALPLQIPGDEDCDHGRKRHRVAMREVGESQHRIDHGHAERAERQLRAIGKRRDQHEIAQQHQRVQPINEHI